MMKKDASREEVVAYVARLMKADPDMPYAAIVKRARQDGYQVYPLIAGLAKRAAGLPPGPRRLSGKPKSKRGPGRPPKVRTAMAPAAGRRTSAGDIVSMLTGLTSELESMRAALREIAAVAARF